MTILASFLLPVVLLFGATNIASASNPLDIYLFWGNGCPHCVKEKVYLEELLPEYPNVKLNDFEIYHNRNNIALMQEVSQELGFNSSGVPLLIIGDEDIIGFMEGTTEKEIEDRIQYCSRVSCPDSVGQIVGVSPTAIPEPENQNDNNAQETTEKIIKLPIIGEVNALNYSLPAITILIGALDGFNPCAMWTLLFLISLLIGMKNRKKMWLLGSAFIVASAFVYFLFMAAWLNLILFLGFVVWVRLVIGAIALVGGGYSIKKGIENKDGGCEITGSEKRQATFERIKKITQHNSLWIALGGIILLAFAVNLVELLCSAGLPAVYTQILTLNDLAAWQYYGYLLLYIFFFMLDDLIIFFIAMTTLKLTGISTKYSKYSSLIGGVIMIIIGLLLIFKPEFLMFG